jgi:uncharacterized protein (DUF58 family)
MPETLQASAADLPQPDPQLQSTGARALPDAPRDRPRFRPGKNLVRVAYVLPATATLYFLFPSMAWLWLGSLIAATVGVAAIVETRQLRRDISRVSVRRIVPVVTGRDIPFLIHWHVSNDLPMSVTLEVRDALPARAEPRYYARELSLAAAGKTEWSSSFRISERGLHTIGPIWLRLRGRLNLMEAQQPLAMVNQIKILPEKLASRAELLKDVGAQQLLLDKNSPTRLHGVGTDFESLSEYREGDDPRRIDWRATARMQRPVVRRFQIERHRDVMILVDCGRLMGTEANRGTKLDCAIDSALILARTALRGGDRCGMAVYDSELRGYLPPVSGLPWLQSLTDSLYDIRSEFRETDFGTIFATLQTRQSKRSLIVILSDVIDLETSELFRSSLARLSRRHVVLFAALQTPSLVAVTRSKIDTLDDAARHAVAFRVLHQRRQAIHGLRQHGIHVLDVEPSQMTVPLVNQFIELRGRNLL